MDTGDYNRVPAIVNPKYDPLRFYRIANKGTNSGEIPFVTITSPTNGATLSGEIAISVVATSSYPIVSHTLFIDGQEMNASEDGTNYVINTCEWSNGSHVIFATATADSNMQTSVSTTSGDRGRAVSAYVPVTFDNLINKIAFSEEFFEPSLGQTQIVSAAFAANVDWTLDILNESSNAVLTVTGSGTSMTYAWDGTGTGGTNIPDGIYLYAISAETNGLAGDTGGGGGGSTNPPPPTPSASFSGGGEFGFFELALPPLPPGLEYEDENGNEITSFTVGWPSFNNESELLLETTTSSFTSSFSSPTQSTVAPTRPPTARVKNTVATFGVAYYSYPQPRSVSAPLNGFPGLQQKIQLEGTTQNRTINTLTTAPKLATDFANAMKKGGWKMGFKKTAPELTFQQLRRSNLGGANLFGDVNLGLFVGHGVYGTSLDYHSDANQSYQTYLAGDGNDTWLRLSELGTDGGNLRWLGILACSQLHDQQYQSMLNKGVLPIRNGFHLLLSLKNVGGITDHIGRLWATKMFSGFFSHPTIRESWYYAGTEAYKNASANTFPEDVYFRVAGWENCMDDTLTDYPASTSGDIELRELKVSP